MALTPEQKVVLKAHILTTPDLLAIYENGDLTALAAALNTQAIPDYWAWDLTTSQEKIFKDPGFDWLRVDNLSIGKARIWEWMFRNTTVSIDPFNENVRKGIMEAWKGTAADLGVRLVVLQCCQSKVSRTERLFVTGPGAPTNDQGVGPGDRGYFGPVAQDELVGL